jgi:hypothetical protein
MKTYAIGDIHGAYKALMQCFELSEFDYKKDRLIVMGDGLLLYCIIVLYIQWWYGINHTGAEWSVLHLGHLSAVWF